MNPIFVLVNNDQIVYKGLPTLVLVSLSEGTIEILIFLDLAARYNNARI